MRCAAAFIVIAAPSAVSQHVENIPGQPHPDGYDCSTKEVWGIHKSAWCCREKNLGCPTCDAETMELKMCGRCDDLCMGTDFMSKLMPAQMACTADCRPPECGCKSGFIRFPEWSKSGDGGGEKCIRADHCREEGKHHCEYHNLLRVPPATLASQFEFFGTAEYTGHWMNGFELTKALNGQKGGVFGIDLIDPSDFELTFEFNVGNRDAGADGLTMTVADTARWDKQLGDGGTCMGSCVYTPSAGHKSIPGFVVEFDTWKSGVRRGHTPRVGAEWDTTHKDHVAAFLDGVGGVRIGNSGDVIVGPDGDLENGAWHTAKVLSSNGELVVTVNDKVRIREAYTPSFSEGRWGWTAATGGERNQHRVRDIRLCKPSAFVTTSPSASPAAEAAVVAGDPFVTDPTGAKKQFFLPLQKDVLLLACNDLKLYGRAFSTGIEGDTQQWFEWFRMSSQGKDLLEVGLQKRTNQTNQTALDDGIGLKELSLLSVSVEGNEMRKTGALGLDDASLIAVWSSEAGEAVQFSHGSIVIQIKSAVANKFEDKDAQHSFMHLDVRFVELKTAECSGGILAEIWGAIPMSQATAEMLLPPQ